MVSDETETRLGHAIMIAAQAADNDEYPASMDREPTLRTGRPYLKYCRNVCRKPTYHWYSYTVKDIAVQDEVNGRKRVDRNTHGDCYACNDCGLTRLELRPIPGDGETISYDVELGMFVVIQKRQEKVDVASAGSE